MDNNMDRLTGQKSSQVTQYLATLCSSLGALSIGIVLGYSSPSSATFKPLNDTDLDCQLIEGEALNHKHLATYSSILSIGAIVGVIVGGFSINLIGRRGTMIASLFPYIVGWSLIAGAASNFPMLLAGRALCGMCCGAVSIAVPTYVGEIASPDIRGRLGSGFQLFVTVGILYSYALGAALCWQWLVFPCAVPCVIFGVSMIFNKESSTFLLARDKHYKAKVSLQYFRGKDYNIDTELKKLQEAVKYARENKAKLKDLMKPHIRKPLLISLCLMALQQFTGINALLFNLKAIFQRADIEMSADAASIIVAAVQVAATFLATLLIDKVGRRPLLILSSSVMTISLITLGTYFYLQNEKKADNLDWMPVTSLATFIIALNFGFGPVPWVIMGEVFSADVKEVAASIAAVTMWSCSFIVTYCFEQLQEAIHDYGVFWLLAGMCALGFVFSVFVVKETKGKTMEDITTMFGGIPIIKENINPSTTVVSIS